ncbi:MAG: hypothetical protein GX748_05990, partial [Lentisphaerae bacterium]|nr:hypothetical protein [Lentisphaerota bacterium]
VLDLPNGSASDRMIARFLRERAGANRQVSQSVLKRITTDIGGGAAAGEKLAVLKGGVTTVEVSPHTVVDPVGACLSQVTASATLPRVNPVRVKIGFDAKFLDVNNAFATVASVKGFGDHLKNVGQSLGDQLVAMLTLRNVFLLVVVAVVCWLISRLMFRVR